MRAQERDGASHPGLQLRPERIGTSVLITVIGELDAPNSRALELLGAEALDDIEVDRLLLDCSAVSHVGSHGLGSLIELDRAASERGAAMRIAQPSRVLLRLLDLAGLTRVIADSPSEPTDGPRLAVA